MNAEFTSAPSNLLVHERLKLRENSNIMYPTPVLYAVYVRVARTESMHLYSKKKQKHFYCKYIYIIYLC